MPVSLVLDGFLYAGAPQLNHEGFPAFTHDIAEQALQVLMTSSLGDTFYVRREVFTGQAIRVLSLAATTDPELFAHSLVYAREAGSMRLLPTLGLALLSKAHPSYFAVVFPRVIKTQRELRDFLIICRQGGIRGGLGRSVKRAVGKYLLDLSEYHFIKYGRAHGDFSLRDALRLVRPKPTSERQQLMALLIAKGVRAVSDDLLGSVFPQIACWKEFLETRDSTRRLQLIERGRLPYEAVLGAMRPNPTMWRALVCQMPTMALLRHLATLTRSGALDQEETLDYVCQRLTDPRAVRASRILPFRFYTAWSTLSSNVGGQSRVFERLNETLEQALHASLSNLPDLQGSVCIGVDVSGSMDWGLFPDAQNDCPLTSRRTSGPRLVEVAALFAAGLAHRYADSARVIPFNERALQFHDDPDMSVLDTVRRISKMCAGGTDLSAPLRLLLERNASVSHFIGITDCEEWTHRGFLSAWRRYRDRVNPKAQAYLLTLAPYGHSPTPPSEPGVHYFYGWSEELVRHLALSASGGTQLSAVREWTKDIDLSAG